MIHSHHQQAHSWPLSWLEVHKSPNRHQIQNTASCALQPTLLAHPHGFPASAKFSMCSCPFTVKWWLVMQNSAHWLLSYPCPAPIMPKLMLCSTSTTNINAVELPNCRRKCCGAPMLPKSTLCSTKLSTSNYQHQCCATPLLPTLMLWSTSTTNINAVELR